MSYTIKYIFGSVRVTRLKREEDTIRSGKLSMDI